MRIEPRFAIKLITVLVATGVPTVADASDPSYDELFAYRFEALTGYEPTESGVREALQNIDELGYEGALAAIATVGEMRYVSLTSHIKELLGEPRWTQHIVRALIRCHDPEAEKIVRDQISKLRGPEHNESVSVIRNAKYFVIDPATDATGMYQLMIGDPPIPDDISVAAIEELAEVYRVYRHTADPRFPKCKVYFDSTIEKLRESLPTAIENLSDNRKRQVLRTSLSTLEYIGKDLYRGRLMRWSVPGLPDLPRAYSPDDMLILDEILVYALESKDEGSQ